MSPPVDILAAPVSLWLDRLIPLQLSHGSVISQRRDKGHNHVTPLGVFINRHLAIVKLAPIVSANRDNTHTPNLTIMDLTGTIADGLSHFYVHSSQSRKFCSTIKTIF